MGKTKKITISVIAVLALLILVSTAVVLYFVIREANYPRHTVSFETGEILNKNEFQDKRYKEGSVLQEWDGVPLVADKMFLDWYADAELEEKVVFPLTITEDITVYAKYLDGNLPESFYQYDAESDSYFVVKGTEDLPETTIVPDVHNGANGVKRVTKIEGGTKSGSSIDKNTLPLGNSTTVKNLYIGNCVSSIGKYAAAYNTVLEYAYIGRNAETYGIYIFRGCSVLTDATLPQKMTKVPDGMFQEAGFTSLDFLGENITTIGQQAFRLCPFIELVIPEHITSLDNGAFYQCKTMTSVVGNKVKTFGDYVFQSCQNLGSIQFNEIEIMEKGQAFDSCTNLTSVSLPKLKYIGGEWAFEKCSSLQEISLPNLEYLGNSTFLYCSKLTSVSLPKLKYMGSGAFDSTKVDPFFPEGLIWIGDHAFSHCADSTIESITIPKSVVQIGGTEFVGDNEENNILSSHIFYNCATATLKEIKVAEGNKHFDAVDGVLYTKNHKYLISYPPAKTDTTYEALEGCVDFGELSFSRNHYLETLILPNSFKIHTDLPSYYEVVEKEPECKYTNLAVAIYAFTTIREYKLKEDNPNYKEIDGIIYSKDGKELMAVPMAKAKGETLTFDENLEVIDKLVFYYNQGSTTYNDVSVGGIPSKIVIGSNVKTISDDVLAYLNNECHKVVSGTFGWTLESQSPNFEVDETGKLVRKEA